MVDILGSLLDRRTVWLKDSLHYPKEISYKLSYLFSGTKLLYFTTCSQKCTKLTVRPLCSNLRFGAQHSQSSMRTRSSCAWKLLESSMFFHEVIVSFEYIVLG